MATAPSNLLIITVSFFSFCKYQSLGQSDETFLLYLTLKLTKIINISIEVYDLLKRKQF